MRPGSGAGRLGLSHRPFPLSGVSGRSIWPHWHCLIPHAPAFHPGHMAANFALALEMTLNSTAKYHAQVLLLSSFGMQVVPWEAKPGTLVCSAQDMRKILFLHPLCHTICSHSSRLHLLELMEGKAGTSALRSQHSARGEPSRSIQLPCGSTVLQAVHAQHFKWCSFHTSRSFLEHQLTR